MRRSPRDTAESYRRVSRRAMMIGGVQLVVGGALALRMRYLEVVQASQFKLLAEQNRISIRLLPPARGLIYDRSGRLLAGNEQNYRVVMVREDAGDYLAVLERLATIVPLSTAELARARKELARRSPFVPVAIGNRLSWDTLARVAVNAPALPGVHPDVGLSRIYPLADDFAHLVGYVGPVSDYDLKRLKDPDPLLQIPRFQIGKVGVEARMEHKLRGRAGIKRIEVNALGRVIRELGRKPSVPGADLQLTIDAGVQNFVQARLGEESAAAALIDVSNGELLAIASTPSFDPNKFVRGISVADYRALMDNGYRPLADKSVQGTYPPGSTFKLVLAIAALEAGAVTPDETIICNGYIDVAKRRFHGWRRGGHGRVNLHKSIQQSCDIYYYELAQRLGIAKIAAMANRLGLGRRYDLPLSGMARGLVPTKDWKRRNYGASWLIGDTLNAGIGQGYVLASPLQLAVMTARIASGRAIEPRLIKSIDAVEAPRPAWASLGLADQTLSAVRTGMFAVSNTRRGTAYSSRIAEKPMRMAGKTGTSQVRNITKAERATGVINNRDLPWKQRDHALFVAFAPYDAPRFAVSVVVEHGGGGSTAAAPIARDILLRALYGKLPPLSAYPRSQRRQIETAFGALQLRTFAPLTKTPSRA